MTTIVFAGGGTGGHIFPGLAVADELRKDPDTRILWIGSSRGMDRSLVEGHGIEFRGIPSGKLRRYFSLQNIADLFRIVAGFFAAYGILRKERPSLLFSKGGFVSVPPCFAAKFLKIPVVTHECDVTPGLATRLNSRVAQAIFVSFDETIGYLGPDQKKKAFVTGNPVRSGFYNASPRRGRAFLGLPEDSLPILFVQGGSLGAKQVNDLIAQCLDRLCSRFVVVHQTGSAHFEELSRSMEGAGRMNYKPFPFIKDEMADVLAASSLVVARSGANTVWECAALGKPMILIPLEGSGTRGDQVDNARFFVQRGAAVMLTGADATAENLASAAERIGDSEKLRSDMGCNALSLSGAPPASVIARSLWEIINPSGGGAR